MRIAALLLALAAGGTALGSTACAAHSPSARSISPPAASPISSGRAAIDALVARGCYRCLEHAYDAAVSAADHVRTFETALLLVARAKELGLPYAPWLERARAATPGGPDWGDYLSIVQALRIDPLADDRDVILVDTMRNRASAETVAGWRTDLASGAGSPLLRTYLELSLICQYIVDDRNVTIATAVQRFPDVPLIEYRAGICGASQEPHLAAVRDALLGRVVTLSHLSRHDDAIAAATRIIELGSWFTGEAYYWRAWNEYHLVRVDEART